jgi:hypothetical protein
LVYKRRFLQLLNQLFLKFNYRDILDNAGSISQEVTKELALEVYIDDVNRCKTIKK